MRGAGPLPGVEPHEGRPEYRIHTNARSCPARGQATFQLRETKRLSKENDSPSIQGLECIVPEPDDSALADSECAQPVDADFEFTDVRRGHGRGET